MAPRRYYEVASVLERRIFGLLLAHTRVTLDDVAGRAACDPKTVRRFLAGEPVAAAAAVRRAAVEALMGPHLLPLVAAEASRERLAIAARVGDSMSALLDPRPGANDLGADEILLSLHVLAIDMGLRWAAYRHLCGMPPVDDALAGVLVGFLPAAARRRGESGDVLEHLVRARIVDVGPRPMDTLARATGFSRRALDGCLRGYRPVTEQALRSISGALARARAGTDLEALHFALRVAAAAQDLQLRSGLDSALLRSGFATLLECTRRVHATLAAWRWDRPVVAELLLRGCACPIGTRLLRGGSVFAEHLPTRVLMALLSAGDQAPLSAIREGWMRASRSTNSKAIERREGHWALDDEADARVVGDVAALLFALGPPLDLPPGQAQMVRAGQILGLLAGRFPRPPAVCEREHADDWPIDHACPG